MLLLEALSSKMQEEFVYGQYSYQVDFSKKLNDRIRYDNYDDTWPVSTKPHHFHPQNKKDAIESQMIGDPAHDIPLLINKMQDYL